MPTGLAVDRQQQRTAAKAQHDAVVASLRVEMTVALGQKRMPTL